MKNLAQHVLLLVAVSGGAAIAQEAPLPKICQEIEQEARAAVARWQGEPRPDAIHKWAIATAPRIAASYERCALASLIYGWMAGYDDAWLQGGERELSPDEASQLREILLLAKAVTALSVAVCIEIADPDDQYALKSAQRQFGREWISLGKLNTDPMAAAVDVWHDDWASDVFMNCVLIAVKEVPEHAFGAEAIYLHIAAGFLRSYEPKKVRPVIERALELVEGQMDETDCSFWRLRLLRGMEYDLRTNLAWLAYAEGLKTREQRQRYTDFQRRLWRAKCVAPRGSHLPHAYEKRVAHLVKEDWHSGDGQFVVEMTRVRLMIRELMMDERTMVPSDSTEAYVCEYLANQLTEEETEQLRFLEEHGRQPQKR